MDTFPFALSKEKYPWILFPEMKSYPFAERALVRPLRSGILQLDHRESKTLLFSFSNPHKNYDFNNFISGKSTHGYFFRNTVRGKVSMDTFPGNGIVSDPGNIDISAGPLSNIVISFYTIQNSLVSL